MIRRLGLKDYIRVLTFKEKENIDYSVPFVTEKNSMPLRIYNRVNLLLSFVSTSLALKKFVLYGFFKDGRLNGIIYLITNSSPYEIGLFVNKSWRRQGNGKRLMKRAISHAKRKGVPLFLSVSEWNVSASNLYKSLGFEEYKRLIYMRRSV